ncbi:ABC transporter ATP-binding protein [Neomegalonema sp.]|uniref:ABC transporter ATP-binding protein n=1 Tax=Neomegalonema sp. TaxID=2039713 RepID=UPI002635A401|nr:ABC transporter ATP-binding protein [Neomegalonema sp.]MDD2867435.1 ABC transporter ATP-binding protein [Neomegalonema sp.]
MFKSYPTSRGARVILEGANVVIPTDRNVGVLGRNGAGKSTLMRMIAGVEAPDMGEILCDRTISPPIGFGGLLNPKLTGEENILYAARLYDQDPDLTVAYGRLFAEIGDYFHMPVRTYSSGMRARMTFALTAAIDFEVYLIDEVLAVGDKAFKEKCKRFFHERRGRSSMLIVSHQASTIAEFCDCAAVLRSGELTFYDDLKDARQAHEL